MSEHTPGPWHIVPKWHSAVNSEKKHIAMINFWNSDDEQRVGEEEHQANARLIAAAWSIPKLVAACEAAMTFLEDPEPELGTSDALWEQLKAATGGSNS